MKELIRSTTRVMNLIYLFLLIWGINVAMSWIMSFA